MRGNVKHTTIQRWLPAVIWMALIFFVSSRSQPPSPADPTLDFVWKKSVHVASYALLAVLLRHALGSSPHRTRWAFVLAVLYALTDEYHQSFVPGRSARLTDVLIDATGATIGLGVLRARRAVIAGKARSLRGRHDPANDEPTA